MTSRRPRWPILAALLISICGLMAAPPEIAVFNFTDATGSANLGQMIPDLIDICLLASPDEVVVLERRQIDDLLREHSLSLAQATDQHALQLGRILATDYLAFGGIRKEGAALVISMRLVDSKTTEIKALDEVAGEIARFNTILPLLIGKVLAKLQNADEATAEQLAARHRTPAGMPIERFTAAMAAAEQLDFGNALAHLRACLSLDPAYADTRTRFVAKKNLPRIPSLPVSTMTLSKQPHSLIYSLKQLYTKLRGKEPEGYYVYDDVNKKRLFRLHPVNPAVSYINPPEKLTGRLDRFWIDNYQYDLTSGKLFSVIAINDGSASPAGFMLKAWDMATGELVADWKGTGRIDGERVSRPWVANFTGRGTGPEVLIPMMSDNLKAPNVSGGNKRQPYWQIHDLLSGNMVATLPPPPGCPANPGEYAGIVDSNRSWLLAEGMLIIGYQQRFINSRWGGFESYGFYDLISGKPIRSFYMPSSTVFNAQLYKDGDNRAVVAFSTGKGLDLFRIADGQPILSRVESPVSRFQAKTRLYGDNRNFSVVIRGSDYLSGKAIGLLQDGLIAPAFLGNEDMSGCHIVDIDEDAISEVVTKNSIYHVAEAGSYRPCENNLVDTWVFSSSAFNDKAQQELSRLEDGNPPPELRSSQWGDTWYLYQNCALPLLRSIIGNSSRHYVFDSRGLGYLVKGKRIIPEVDVDDFSSTRAYHLIRARWQLTVMLDFTLGKNSVAKCEIVDNSKPVKVPAFLVEKIGPDLNANVIACLREANQFLAANNSPLIGQNHPAALPVPSGKTPIAVLDFNALPTPMHDSNNRAAAACTQAVQSAFHQSGAFRLLERAELRTIMEEQTLSRIGRNPPPADGIIPSALVLAGVLIPTLSGDQLVLRIYDTETGIILSTFTYGGDAAGGLPPPKVVNAYVRQVTDVSLVSDLLYYNLHSF